MSRRRLDVQLCVANMTTKQYGPHPTSDLLGVDYLRSYLPDTEFPRTMSRLDVFARFFFDPPNPADPLAVAVRVWWLRADGRNRTLVNHFDFSVGVGPDATVHEQVFRLVNVNVPGEGVYAVRLCRPGRHRWKGRGWVARATDYYQVVRS